MAKPEPTAATMYAPIWRAPKFMLGDEKPATPLPLPEADLAVLELLELPVLPELPEELESSEAPVAVGAEVTVPVPSLPA